MLSDLFDWVKDTFFGSTARTATTAAAISSVASYAGARKQAKALSSMAPSSIKVSTPPAPVKLGQLATTIPRSQTTRSKKRKSLLADSGEPQGLLS